MNKGYAWFWLEEDMVMPIPKKYMVNPIPVSEKLAVDENGGFVTPEEILEGTSYAFARPGTTFKIKDKRASVCYASSAYMNERYRGQKKMDLAYPEKQGHYRRTSKGFRAYTNVLDAFASVDIAGPILCRVEIRDRVSSHDSYSFISGTELEVLWTYDATEEIKKFGLYCAKIVVAEVAGFCPSEIFQKIMQVIQIAQLSLQGNSKAKLLFDTFGINFSEFAEHISSLCRASHLCNNNIKIIIRAAEVAVEANRLDETPARSAQAIYTYMPCHEGFPGTLGIEKWRASSILMNLLAAKIPEQTPTPSFNTWIVVGGEGWTEQVGAGLATTHPYCVEVHSGVDLIGAEKRWFPRRPEQVAHRRHMHLNALEAFLEAPNTPYGFLGSPPQYTVARIRVSGPVKLTNNLVFASRMQILWSADASRAIEEVVASYESELNENEKMIQKIQTTDVTAKIIRSLAQRFSPKELDELDTRIEKAFMKLAPEHEIAKIMEMEWMMPEEPCNTGEDSVPCEESKACP